MTDNPPKAGTQICAETRLSEEKTTANTPEVFNHYFLRLDLSSPAVSCGECHFPSGHCRIHVSLTDCSWQYM